MKSSLLVEKALAAYKDRFSQVFLISLITIGPIAVIFNLVDSSSHAGQSLQSIVYIFLAAFLSGFLVLLVENYRKGKTITTEGTIKPALPHLANLATNALLRTVLVSIGLIFFIVPGLFLMTIWSVSAPAVVKDKLGPIAALKRSAELTEGNRWSVFVAFLLLLLVLLVILVALSFVILLLAVPLSLTSLSDDALTTVLVFLTGVVVAVLLAPISSLLEDTIYFELLDAKKPRRTKGTAKNNSSRSAKKTAKKTTRKPAKKTAKKTTGKAAKSSKKK